MKVGNIVAQAIGLFVVAVAAHSVGTVNAERAAEAAAPEVVTQVETVYEEKVVEVPVEIVPQSCVDLASRVTELIEAADTIAKNEYDSATIANETLAFMNLGDAEGIARSSRDFRLERKELLEPYQVMHNFSFNQSDLIERCTSAVS